MMGRESQGVGDDAFLCLDAKWGVTAFRSHRIPLDQCSGKAEAMIALQHRSLNMFQLYNIYIYIYTCRNRLEGVKACQSDVLGLNRDNKMILGELNQHLQTRGPFNFPAAFLKFRNVISYSAAVSACASGLQWQRALLLLEEVKMKRLESNSVASNRMGGTVALWLWPPLFWVAGESENEKKKLVWEQGQPQV